MSFSLGIDDVLFVVSCLVKRSHFLSTQAGRNLVIVRYGRHPGVYLLVLLHLRHLVGRLHEGAETLDLSLIEATVINLKGIGLCVDVFKEVIARLVEWVGATSAVLARKLVCALSLTYGSAVIHYLEIYALALALLRGLEVVGLHCLGAWGVQGLVHFDLLGQFSLLVGHVVVWSHKASHLAAVSLAHVQFEVD